MPTPRDWQIDTTLRLTDEKGGELKTVETGTKPVNWNYCRCTTYCRTQQRQERSVGMTIWWTSPHPIIESADSQIQSLHQVATGTPSHVPLQRRAIIITMFRGSGTNCMVGPYIFEFFHRIFEFSRHISKYRPLSKAGLPSSARP